MARAASYRCLCCCCCFPPEKRVKSKEHKWRGIAHVLSLSREKYFVFLYVCVCMWGEVERARERGSADTGAWAPCALPLPLPHTSSLPTLPLRLLTALLWARESETTREQVLQLVYEMWAVPPPAPPNRSPPHTAAAVWKCMTLDLEKTHSGNK